jgi:hypothetical protein
MRRMSRRRGAGGAQRAAQDLLGAEAGRVPSGCRTDVARMLTLNSEQQRAGRAPHLPAAVRHRRPGDPALLEPGRAGVRSVHGARHGADARDQARPPRGRRRARSRRAIAMRSIICARPRRIGRCRACSRAWKENPAYRRMRRDQGRRLGRNNAHRVMTWCPLEYRELARMLRISQRMPAAEVRAIVEQQIEKDRRQPSLDASAFASASADKPAPKEQAR